MAENLAAPATVGFPNPLIVFAFITNNIQYARFEDLRADIVDILKRWGYQIHWMDTTQGVPQSRPRFYLAALPRPVPERKFGFPLELPAPDLLRSWIPRARRRGKRQPLRRL